MAWSEGAADLNGDGNVDLAVANLLGNDVSVLLNSGDGTFDDAVAYTTQSAQDLAVGDVDDDGDADLVVRRANGINDVLVLLNAGDGSFVPGYSFDSDANALALDDLNDDGFPDLVEADFDSDTVSVRLGVGDGTFAAPVAYTVAGGRDLAIDDLDGDGDLDIVVAADNWDDYSGYGQAWVTVLLGAGDGTVGAPATYPLPYDVEHLSFITTADLDGDSDVDVVTGPGGAQVLLNTGNGTLAWHDQYPGGMDSWSLASFAFSDLDGDGDTDYAATLSYSTTNLVQIVLSRCDESSGRC